ncbi:MAG: ABC transporter ATP-binding protein [Candidatus Omnitrophota bacterium]
MLEATGLHKTYDHLSAPLHVLKGVDFKINRGETVAVVGPSGAGKSTLLHILGGLDRPSEGKVLFEGREIYSLSDRQRADIRNNQAGFVFQFYHLLPEFTALENVILPALIKNDMRQKKEAQQKGLELLEKVGLGKRVSHRPNELSGGEQQRVAIARALMNDPKIIFCDEPTGNLDSQSGQEVVDLLLKLNKENQQALIIVTHDEAIAKRTQKILHIRDGKILS